jgi:CBS domain-containing protein
MQRHALRLDVRTRRTLHSDWREEETSFVPCPVTGGSRSLEQCRTCERNSGLVHDSEGHAFVVCRASGIEPVPEVIPRFDPSWQRLTVGEVMATEPLCIHADVKLPEVVALLVEHGISGAPVVDDDGKPIGMVSKTDLVMEDYEEAEDKELGSWTGLPPHSKKLARNIMTQGAVTISDRAPLAEAVVRMADHGVHRLAVVDTAGALVGVLSTLDVLRTIAPSTCRPEQAAGSRCSSSSSS